MMDVDESPELRHRFYAYISAFITCIYGHRPGVLSNMTVAEVEAAKTATQSAESTGFVVNVSE